MSEADEESLKKFRLLEREEKVIPPHRPNWRREALYQSSICIAVHVSPEGLDARTPKTIDEAKRALFHYLRQINQTFLEYGVVMPVAAVVDLENSDKEKGLARIIRGWSSEQDWHRGSFTLYVEESREDCDKRLGDLMLPTGEAMQSPQNKTNGMERFIAGIREADGPEGKQIRQRCIEYLRQTERAYDPATQEAFTDAMREWQTRRLEELRSTARGKGQP